MEVGQVLSLSPSFNAYSNGDLAETAARVVDEFDSEEIDDDQFYFERAEKSEENSGDEFEFTFVTTTSDYSDVPSPISADEIFDNGSIRARPVYPVFNTDLLRFGDMENGVQSSDCPKAIRLPLRELFIEERGTTITTTSSELDGLPAETYCVWRPRTAEEEEECEKKSSGGGSNSKKWKFRDLLNREALIERWR